MTNDIREAPNTRMASDKEKSAGRSFYHPELDILRFFAFLMVFICHAGFRLPHFPGLGNAIRVAGIHGVDIFFTLSSYLISELLLREYDREGEIHWRSFYIRRILRIWPLYFMFLLAICPIYAWFFPSEKLPWSYLLGFLFMAGNWVCVVNGTANGPAGPLWSVSIEEQFYLIWPFIVGRWRHHLVRVALILVAVANLVRLVLVLLNTPDPGIWCNTLARLDPIALGAMLASLLHKRPLEMRWSIRATLLFVAGAMLVWSGAFGEQEGVKSLYTYPIVAAASILLLRAVLLPFGSWRPGRVFRGVIYLGKISYGLYVFHLLALDLVYRAGLHLTAARGAGLAVTILLAAASYHWLESPFLRLKDRFTFVRSRPVGN